MLNKRTCGLMFIAAVILFQHQVGWTQTPTDEPITKSRTDVEDTSDVVFSAGKLPKRLEEAPSIITLYSDDHIDKYKFRTLNELLRSTPGFDVRTASWRETPATRGIQDSALLLIDGTPLNSFVTNLFPAEYSLDLFNYKRVEVISGPGGVLWGAHSLLGVVNLLTYDGADIEGVDLAAELGSFGHQRYRMRAGSKWDDFDAYMGVSFATRRNDNVDINGTTSETAAYTGRYSPGVDGSTENEQDLYVDFLAKLKYKKITLFARIPYSKKYFQVSEQGGLLNVGDNGFRQDDAWLSYLQYADNFLGRDLGVLAKWYFYRTVVKFDDRLWSPSANPAVAFPNGFGSYQDQGTALKFGGILEGTWSISLSKGVENTLIGGMDGAFETISGATVSQSDANGFYGPSEPFIADENAFAISGYFNDEVRLFDRVALSGGLRYNHADSYQSTFVASASVVGRVYEKNYIKGKISQGLRPPTMQHRFGLPPVSAPQGALQDPDNPFVPIVADKSTAYEIELNSQFLENVGPIDRFFIRVSGARTLVRDLKTPIISLADPEVQYFLGVVDRDIWSAEVRLDSQILRNYGVWFIYGWNLVQLPNTVERNPGSGDLTNTAANTGPRHKVGFGASATFFRHLRLFMRGVGEMAGDRMVLNMDPTVPRGGQPLVETDSSVFLLSAGASIINLYRDLSLSLTGYNLLNQHDGNWGAFQNQLTPIDSANFNGVAADALRYTQEGVSFMLSAQMSVF